MKSKDHMNLRVTYSLWALWKATPKDRKSDLFSSIFIPLALSLVLATASGLIGLYATKSIFAFAFVFVPSFIYMMVMFIKGLASSSLTTFTGDTFYPDSLVRMKYVTTNWDKETIQFYLESKEGQRRNFTLEEFLEHFQGNYQLYYREEGIMGKGNIPTDINQIREMQSYFTPLQIDIEIQKDGKIAICIDQREERWYDNKQLEN